MMKIVRNDAGDTKRRALRATVSQAALLMGLAAVALPGTATAQTINYTGSASGANCINATGTNGGVVYSCDQGGAPYSQGAGLDVDNTSGDVTFAVTGTTAVTNTDDTSANLGHAIVLDVDAASSADATLDISQSVVATGNGTGPNTSGGRGATAHQFGSGALTVDLDGTVNGQGSLPGDGLLATITSATNANALTVNVGATGVATSVNAYGVSLNHNGTGDARLDNAGSITNNSTASATGGAAVSTIGGSQVIVENRAGGVMRGRDGLFVNQQGTGAVTVNNQGRMDNGPSGGSNGLRIRSTLNTAANTGAIAVTNGASGVIEGSEGVAISHVGNGAVTVTNAGRIEGKTKAGIAAGLGGGLHAVSTGDLTITNQAGGRITASGTDTTNAGIAGIRATHNGSGNTTVTNAGTITNLNGESGIRLDHTAATAGQGVVTVNNTGTITAGSRGLTIGANDAQSLAVNHSGIIDVGNVGTGWGMIVSTNDVTGSATIDIRSNGTSTDEINVAKNTGIGVLGEFRNAGHAVNFNLGKDASIVMSGSGGTGVRLSSFGQTQANGGSFAADIAGTIDAPGSSGTGLRVEGLGNEAAAAITVRESGSINAGADAIRYIGLQQNNGSVPVNVTVEAGATVTAGSIAIIEAQSGGATVTSVPLISTVDIAGTVSGGFYAIGLGGNDDTLVLRETASITGDVFGGDGTDTLRFDYAGAGTFDASLIGTQFKEFETFEKAGLGALTLTGTNAGARTIDVRAGMVVANASLTGTAFQIGTFGTLGGSGTVASIAASGTVAPGNSIGTLNVQGNVGFAAGSTYRAEVDAAGNADLIDAVGAVTIAPTATTLDVVALGAAALFQPPRTYTVIRAQGGVSGRFATLTDNLPDLDFEATYSADAVRLNLVGSASSGATPGNGGTGGNGGLSDKTVLPAAALAGLQPAFALTSAASDRGRHALARIERGQSGPLFFADPGAEAGGKAGGFEPLPAGPSYGVFLEGVGETLEVDDEASRLGYDVSTAGLFGGVEAHLPLAAGDLVLGLSGGYARSNLDTRNGDGDLTAYQGAVFAAYGSGPLALSGAVSYAALDVDLDRRIAIGAGTVIAESDTSGHALGLVADAAYDIGARVGLDEVSLSPFARVEAAFASLDGTTETGAGILGLTVEDQDVGQALTQIGLRLATAYETDGAVIRPDVSLAYEHAFGDLGTRADARLAVTNTAFTGAVAGRERHNVHVGAGLSAEGDRITGAIRYDGTFSENAQAHRGSLSFDLRF